MSEQDNFFSQHFSVPSTTWVGIDEASENTTQPHKQNRLSKALGEQTHSIVTSGSSLFCGQYGIILRNMYSMLVRWQLHWKRLPYLMNTSSKENCIQMLTSTQASFTGVFPNLILEFNWSMIFFNILLRLLSIYVLWSWLNLKVILLAVIAGHLDFPPSFFQFCLQSLAWLGILLTGRNRFETQTPRLCGLSRSLFLKLSLDFP